MGRFNVLLYCAVGKPLAQAGSSLIIEWEGVKIGVMGLAEGDWVDTLPAVEPEEVTYMDFVEEGRKLAKKLRVSCTDFSWAGSAGAKT